MSPTVPLVINGKQNQALDVYKVFIANLKAEVDKCDKQKEFVFFKDIHKTLILVRDDRGYFLKIVDKPQAQ